MDEGGSRQSIASRIAVILGATCSFALTFLLGAAAAAPWNGPVIAADSQAAVLYFDRITAGQRLEAFVPTTPKPILTAILGALHASTGGWEASGWSTLLAAALGVTLLGLLATRLAGPAAGGLVVVVLALDPYLLFDEAFSLAVPYALIAWGAAGLLVTGKRPRYGSAGAALAAAVLIRFETIVVVAAAAALLLGAELFARASGDSRWRPPDAAWRTPLLGMVAIPILALHDLILSGDPLYWLTVASRYAASGHADIPTAREIASLIVTRYWGLGALALAAGAGILHLLRSSRIALAAALVAMGPGIALFLVVLAWRHVIVPVRYLTPIDVALVFAAGLEVGDLARRLLQSLPRAGRRVEAAVRLARTGVAGAVLGAGLGIVLTGPGWGADAALMATISQHRALDAALDEAQPRVERELGLAGDALVVYVPDEARVRAAIDLGLPLSRVLGNDGLLSAVAGGRLQRPALVVHVASADGTGGAWAGLETGGTDAQGGLWDARFSDVAKGLWVVAVR